MRSLKPLYRIFIFLLVLCFAAEAGISTYQFDIDNLVEKEKTTDDASEETLSNVLPEAVLPVAQFHVTKWVYLTDVFSTYVPISTTTFLESTPIIITYFEVLFESSIKIKAP